MITEKHKASDSPSLTIIQSFLKAFRSVLYPKGISILESSH